MEDEILAAQSIYCRPSELQIVSESMPTQPTSMTTQSRVVDRHTEADARERHKRDGDIPHRLSRSSAAGAIGEG